MQYNDVIFAVLPCV